MAHAPGNETCPDLLDAIVAATRRIVRERQTRRPRSELERAVGSRRAFGDRVRRALGASDRLSVIAECKRRSPSRGVLRAHYEPAEIARGYERAGAAAVSVLTEPTFFDGDVADLALVARSVSIPVLRKDFLIDDYQLLEAVEAGADAVLLIASALPDDELSRLRARASALGLMPLVEVHDEEDLARAVAAGADVIGVNSRDLRTLDVTPGVLTALIDRIPDSCLAVAESGLRSREDLDRLREAGYDAFLIGERLMTAPDPGGALQALLRGDRRTTEPGRAGGRE